MQILVAGAGIVGVSCAIWLQRAGHDVTIVDRSGPANGTSHGNAGVLAAGAVVPVTVPGLLRKAPRMLFDPDGALFLRWSYLPRLIPFLRKYLSHATDAHVDHYARSMYYLLGDSVDQHESLAKDTPAQKFIHHDDYCFGYKTRADFDADRYGWSKRDAVGVKYSVIPGREYASFDPIFGDAFETVVRCHEHGRISDPGAYVNALADHFVEQGGTLLIDEITDIDVVDLSVTGVHTSNGVLRADHIIFALGPWSKKIAHKMGVKVPFESERGYHIELINPSQSPKAPMMVASGKFVVTPMDGRIRAAGIVEFGGLENGPSTAPFDMIKRQVQKLMPDVRFDDVTEWMGHRPAPADSLPLIGTADDSGSTFQAFGHQHVGLTGGPKTGRIIAGMIAGKTSNADLSPFDPKKHALRGQ
ncbi:MAG: FAD-dependent oxidoreductase [Paracoccaceae bacterium]